MAKATRFRSNSKPEPVTDFRLPSSLSSGDMRAKLASVNDMTVYELGEAIGSRLTDPTDRAPTLTRFIKLLALAPDADGLGGDCLRVYCRLSKDE